MPERKMKFIERKTEKNMKTHMYMYILNITLLNVLIRFLLFQMYTKNAKTMLLK